MEPPSAAATDPDFDTPLACVFTPLVSRVFLSVRVVVLVVFNLSLFSMRRFSTSLLLLAAAAIFLRYPSSLLTVLEVT